jgi:outer membrane receptor for ferric coprogen and ferric-rhodotorulic acid
VVSWSVFTGLNTASAQEAQDGLKIIDELIIVGIRDQRKTKGATGLDLSDFDTPQSLSIIESETIENFALDDINSMLQMTTGVNVDSTETDRTYYSSRGFDITSMHVDGVGVPFGSLIVGDLDTAIYEKVEVLRGSNGLITGIGNPSGTMNYVRKRPSNELDASARVTLGKWDTKRLVADVSTPLTETGSWALRVVGVSQDKGSWLNLNQNDRNVASVIVDGQLSDALTLTAGLTHQDNNSSGVLWGAVPTLYSNGVQTDFDVSTTTSMDWTYWNTLTDTAFVELGWELQPDLILTSSLTYTDYEDQSELFYAYWTTGLDESTGLGLFGYPGKYDAESEDMVWDTSIYGRFDAWGQQHQFTVGVSLADSESKDLDYSALSGFDALPVFPGWQGDEVARPEWAEAYVAGQDDTTLNRFYASLNLALTEHFDLVLGVSAVDYENEGVSWGVSTDSNEDGSSPYIGFTWEVLDDLNLYGSYSDIYQPQFYLNEDLEALGSAEGRSYEIGIKKRFASGLLASVAYFKTEQENLEEFVSYSDGDGVDDTYYDDDFNYSLYRGVDIDSDGFELEVAGQVSDELFIQAGFTSLEMEEPSGDEARTFIPRKTLKFLGSWDPSWNDALSLGLSVRWQDEIYYDSDLGRTNQDAYVLIGGYLSYEVTDSLGLTLNFDNLSDEKYLSSVKYDQSYYAEPRSYSLALDWRY